MKKWMKIGAVLAILGIAAAAAGYYFVYNKPHTNYEKMDADFSLNASDLFNEFKTNKSMAEPKYNGKVVEINGMLTKVEESDSLIIAVFAAVLYSGTTAARAAAYSAQSRFSRSSQRRSWSSVTNSSGLCATAISPGPQMTVGTPSRS